MILFRQMKIKKALKAFGDKGSNRRMSAIDFLASIDKPPVNELIQSLSDKDSIVRECAARALGRTGDQSVVPPLLHAIQTEESGPTKAKMLVALGEIGGSTAKDALFAMLKDEPSDWTFRWVIKALDNGGIEPNSVEEKVYYFSARNDWNAVLDLGDMAIQPLLSLIEAAEVIPCYPHSGALPSPREQAKILAEFGEGVVEPLLDAVVNAKGYLRSDAMWALAIKGVQRAESPLLKCLMKNDSRLRLEAIGALGRLRSAKATEPLVRIVEDVNESDSVRWTAASALGEIASPDTAAPLIKILFNDDEYKTGRDLRDILLSAIVKIKGPTKKLCLDALNDKTLPPDVHIRCNKILARI